MSAMKQIGENLGRRIVLLISSMSCAWITGRDFVRNWSAHRESAIFFGFLFIVAVTAVVLSLRIKVRDA